MEDHSYKEIVEKADKKFKDNLEEKIKNQYQPTQIEPVFSDRDDMFPFDAGGFERRITQVQDFMATQDLRKAQKKVNELIRSGTETKTQDKVNPIVVGLKIYKAYIASLIGPEKQEEVKNTITEVSDWVHFKRNLLDWTVQALINVKEYSRIPGQLERAWKLREADTGPELVEKLFQSHFYCRNFEQQQRIAMYLFKKDKKEKQALWAIHSMLLVYKIQRDKPLLYLDVANLLYLKINKSQTKIYSNVKLIFDLQWERKDYYTCIEILNSNHHAFPNEDEWIIHKMNCFYHSNKGDKIKYFTNEDKQQVGKEVQEKNGLASAINVLFNQVKHRKYTYEPINGIVLQELNKLLQDQVQTKLKGTLDDIRLNDIFFTRRLFDNEVFIVNPHIENHEVEQNQKNRPEYIEDTDALNVILEYIQTMQIFLEKFKPLDANIVTQLEKKETQNIQEIINAIHNKPSYKSNLTYETQQKSTQFAQLEFIKILQDFKIQANLQTPNIFEDMNERFIEKHCLRSSSIEDLRNYLYYMNVNKVTYIFEELINNEQDEKKFMWYSFNYVKVQQYIEQIAQFFHQKNTPLFLQEKMQNLLKLIQNRDGQHLEGLENLLHFLCHMIFSHEWHKNTNVKSRSSLNEISQFEAFITPCQLLHSSLKDNGPHLNNTIQLSYFYSLYGFYWCLQEQNKKLEMKALQYETFSWQQIFLNRQNIKQYDQVLSIEKNQLELIHSTNQYNFKEVELLYETSGFQVINSLFEFKHMLANSYVRDLIRLKWLDCTLLKAARQDKFPIENRQQEINFFTEMQTRHKRGSNLQVNDDISFCQYYQTQHLDKFRLSILMSYLHEDICWECVNHRHSDYVITYYIQAELKKLPLKLQGLFKSKSMGREQWHEIPHPQFRQLVQFKQLLKFRVHTLKLLDAIIEMNTEKVDASLLGLKRAVEQQKNWHNTHCIYKRASISAHTINELDTMNTENTDGDNEVKQERNFVDPALTAQMTWDLVQTMADLLNRVIFTQRACEAENKGLEMDEAECHNRNAGFNNLKRGFYFLDMMLEKHFAAVQTTLEGFLKICDLGQLTAFLQEYTQNCLAVGRQCIFQLLQSLNECVPNPKKPFCEEEQKIQNVEGVSSVRLNLDFGAESLKECRKAVRKLVQDWRSQVEKQVVDVLRKWYEMDPFLKSMDVKSNWIAKNANLEPSLWNEYAHYVNKTEKLHILEWINLLQNYINILNAMKVNN